MRVPNIKPKEELPPPIVAPGEYSGIAETAEWKYSKVSGRPYIQLRIAITVDKSLVFAAYTRKIFDKLPSTEEECKSFKPVDVRIRVKHRVHEDAMYPDVQILEVR